MNLRTIFVTFEFLIRKKGLWQGKEEKLISPSGRDLRGAITAREPESEEDRTNNPLNHWLDYSFVVFVVWLDLGLPNGVLQRHGSISLTTPVGEPEHRETDYPSVGPSKLHRGVGIYATGLPSPRRLQPEFPPATSNDPIFALEWRVSKYGNYEVMPIKYGDSDDPHLFAVCFFPYRKDVASSDEVYERLYLVLCEEWDTRYERLGRHVDVKVSSPRIKSSGSFSRHFLHLGKLRCGVGIYTTGFVVPGRDDRHRLRPELPQATWNDPVFALKWRVGGLGNYEVMPIKYGDSDGPHLFAVCFFLYRKDVAPGDEDYERLCSVSREERDALWYQRLGGIQACRWRTKCSQSGIPPAAPGQALWHGD
ncbi:hypothetical protein DFH08DRAFT_950470 [Mycena albidolilacea]|uniref:Uncharacterized protein n=1 Tax=Mycena albidolilacea TaxID=1033008 RepID=A0AAD7F3Z5_9AGAR|nr:hypothetical protein DFH08DRAFT_950470 [Mycena albidolilacea]